MALKSKADAPRRVDQIGEFHTEVKIIEEEGVAWLPADLRTVIADYHEK